MRKVLMTVALVIMLVLPVLAQRGRGGFRGFGGRNALANKSVQEELKLDDKQKTALKEIFTKQREAFTKAREDKETAKETITKAMEETAKSLTKFREGLTSTQKKRLTECEVQIATKDNNLAIFKNPAVVKTLKLSDKQKDKIKETQTDLEKDVKEVFEEGGKDFKKNFEKIGTLRKDAFAKVVKSFTEDQAKAWKAAAGEKFDYVPDTFGKGGKGGKKGKKNKDDL